jgi:hypothetical protein
MPINSISDFINELQKVKTRRGCEVYFRGHSDKSYLLVPSIYRTNRKIYNEDKIFKEFVLRSPNDFLNEKTTLEKLVKMQHYGLPTRLLDITTNPLVALYFACFEKDKLDGKVIILMIKRKAIKYYDSDTVSILSNIAKRSKTFTIDFDIDADNQDVLDYLVHEIREEKPYFTNIIDINDIKSVIPVKVKQNNNRIIKQSGAFLIFGVNGNKTEPAIIPEEWVLNKELTDDTFEISGINKLNIIEELDILGINEATLFPELEYQAKYINKTYG